MLGVFLFGLAFGVFLGIDLTVCIYERDKRSKK